MLPRTKRVCRCDNTHTLFVNNRVGFGVSFLHRFGCHLINRCICACGHSRRATLDFSPPMSVQGVLA